MLELVVVMGIMSLLAAILLPAAGRVRGLARGLCAAARQRQTAFALIAYAADHDELFPQSVAMRWDERKFISWREPTLLTGFADCGPVEHRSVAEYLNAYLQDARSLFCPNAPREYDYLEDVWRAGDDWNHPGPETDGRSDPVFGSFCLMWSYNGYLVERDRPFRGPKTLAGGPGRSKLLMCDYFGYGHWRNRLAYGTRNAYGSCERLKNAAVTPGTPVSSDFWSLLDRDGSTALSDVRIKLRAAYTDGHVETYSPGEVLTMKASMTYDGTTPYPSAIEPGGDFFIPANAAR